MTAGNPVSRQVMTQQLPGKVIGQGALAHAGLADQQQGMRHAALCQGCSDVTGY